MKSLSGSDLPQPPRHLTRASKAIWRATVAKWDLDDPPSLMLLQGLFEQWDVYCRARAELAGASAVTTTSETGVVHAHPAAKVMKDALAEFRQCLRQLGLEQAEHPDANWATYALGRKGATR